MQSITKQRVEDTLTESGYIPLECSFLVGSIIYRWGPKIHLHAIRMEDNELYYACIAYLRERGRDFNSLREGIDSAIHGKCPHWEMLQRSSE